MTLRAAKTTILHPIFSTLPHRRLSARVTFDSAVNSSKLQYLELSNATIQTKDLECLLKACNRLRKLSLENLLLNNECCLAIAQNSVLNTLNMAMVRGVGASTKAVGMIIRECRQLRELNLSWMGFTMDTLYEISKNLQINIERLNLSGNRDTLVDDHVGEIVMRCPRLQELDLSDCIQLSEVAVKLIRRLARLESLSLSRCYNIVPAEYLQLSELPNFKYLNVFSILKESTEKQLKLRMPGVEINKHCFSAIARPTVGIRRSSIWGLRTKD